MALGEDETQFRERMKKFFHLVGYCISQWAHVDQALFDLCSIALRTPDETTAAVFYQSPNIGAHLALTDKLLQIKFKKQKGRLKSWNKIKSKVEGLLPFRNELAHNPPVQYGGTFMIQIDSSSNNPPTVTQTGESYWSLRVDKRKLFLRPKDGKGQYSKRPHDEIRDTHISDHLKELHQVQSELYKLLKPLRPKKVRAKK